jgi:hypothetical protein
MNDDDGRRILMLVMRVRIVSASMAEVPQGSKTYEESLRGTQTDEGGGGGGSGESETLILEFITVKRGVGGVSASGSNSGCCVSLSLYPVYSARYP